MNIILKIEDNTTMKGYEVQDLVEGQISMSNVLFDSVGKLEFTLLQDDRYKIENGNTVYLYIDGIGKFKGYVFKVTVSDKEKIKVVAYNQLRYLKVKDTVVLETMTASEIFEMLCKKYQINYKIVDSSSLKIAGKIMSDKTIYEIMMDAIDRTLMTSGKWYALIENFGTLEFVDLENLLTNLEIGDGSLVSNYTLDKSIDSDSYNQIKLSRENKTTGKRDVYIVKDSSTINKWGLLQYTETINEDMNEAQIKERADMLLKVKNRETKSLKLSCIGDFRLDVGKGVKISIRNLENFNINSKNYIIISCNHKLDSDKHLMDLELQLEG